MAFSRAGWKGVRKLPVEGHQEAKRGQRNIHPACTAHTVRVPDEIYTDEIPLMTRSLIHIHTDLQITSGSQACIPRNACEHTKRYVHRFAYSQKRK